MNQIHIIRTKQFLCIAGLALIVFIAGNTRSYAQNTSVDPASRNAFQSLLMRFTGEVNGNTASLSWVMENETNCKWFVIERAGDNGRFDSIGVVLGLNNHHQTDYNYNDQHMLNGNNYYRLRQVTQDENIAYSKVINLSFNHAAAATDMQVFPNPAFAQLNYAVNCPAADDVSVQVFSLSGVLISMQQQQLTTGLNQQSIIISSLKSGNYFLKISNRQGTFNYVHAFAKL